MNFNEAIFEKSVGNLNQISNDNLPEIVFSGKSNVGKSSLINKILNRKSLARTSSKPGKTININFYKLKNLRFVDLPGYGYAKVSFSEKRRWSELVEGYFKLERNIPLIVQIVDMRHTPSVLDFQMIDFLYSRGVNFVIVASKCDKLNKTERNLREKLLEKELEKYKDIKKIFFSSVTGEGVEMLKNVINESVKN
ncbi:MAG: YihA family ribosome biogenesis GTP-binding protein [Clostridia bacterium]|nr:YihA family ribosome biogenesis GTP-binding protein [Clostridia bacterium]